MQEDERNAELLRENREFLELLKQSRVNEAKTLENYRVLAAAHEELTRNFQAMEKNCREIAEKYSEAQRNCEQLQQKLAGLQTESRETRANPEAKEINAGKNCAIAEKPAENRRSSTENLDKLIESLLIANQKDFSASKTSSKREFCGKIRSFSSHSRKLPENCAKISYDLSRCLDFSINSRKTQAFSGNFLTFATKSALLQGKFHFRDKLRIKNQRNLTINSSFDENPEEISALSREPLVKTSKNREFVAKTEQFRENFRKVLPVSLKESILKREIASFPAKARKLVDFQGKLLENFPKNCVQDVNALKKACLTRFSRVFRDNCVEVKEKRETFARNGKSYVKMLLFFVNHADSAICKGNCEFYAENGFSP